ncbi:kynureninase [Oceanobacillus neutriphilus]|uniref:Kynureninase n=1 Tax=Oceanobacillus neutriphilus TaxID=531815 RepID=A0ABQ2NP97_9BACI|nr:kynureninase [Oceanobacillus neutriphilus]GGP08310.1 kynureninase [Oceanobacillus neutriphilus]
MEEKYTKAYAEKLDAQDGLRSFRKEFYLNNECVYMDGNSLGLMSKRAEQSVYDLLASWRDYGIDGWTEGEQPWYYLSESLGEKMADLVGAEKEEVVVTGSTTVNLHQLVSTFYNPKGNRTKILADELNFPSDIYALKAQLRGKGYDDSHLIQIQSEDGHTLDEEVIINAMTEDIELIVLPSILYRSGQILDMEKLTKAAHERGIKIGFDLCHSIGAIPHHLHDWDVDFAFWCTYKHLNGGPGSVAALYVNDKHFGVSPGLAGWFSSNKEKQFDMEHTLTPAEDAGAFQIGTPHVLSAAPLIGALDLFHEAGIEKIRRKSLDLTAYMMDLIEYELERYDFVICNPVNDKQRGGHIYLEHAEAARICKALKMKKVIPDFRKPSGIRLAPVALYNSFEDVYDCVQILKNIMQEKVYEQFSNEREVVS